ncbi:MAG: phosphate acyltransferase PlsX [Hyphomicrobiales bacterium]
MKIGLDVMGGDYAPDCAIEGAVLAHKEFLPSEKLVLIGDKNIITSKLSVYDYDKDRIEIVHASEVIEMGDSPTKAFASKVNSSVNIGFTMLKKKEIQAFSSAGNSGAMMVGSMYAINTIPGVIRPACAALIPRLSGGYNILLDVGTNPDTKPDVLYQYAILGSIYASEVFGKKNPKIGLLNIGEEEKKGNLLCQGAYRLMKNSADFNFAGNIEGRDLFDDSADVIVCDGFTGNVVIKEAEGFYDILAKRNLLDDFFGRFNYENQGGSPILGINAPVVIGHGISNGTAIKNMVLLSRNMAAAKLSDKIGSAVARYR